MIREPKNKAEREPKMETLQEKDSVLPSGEPESTEAPDLKTDSQEESTAKVDAPDSEAVEIPKEEITSAAPKVTTLVDDVIAEQVNVEKKKKQLTREEKRARRRRKTDLKISRTMSLVFFAFFFLLAILLLVLPRSTKSEIERRYLAEWPEFSLSAYFSGDYTAGITEYYDDTVPFRDSFKNIGNNIKSLFGLSGQNSVEVIGNVALVNQGTPSEETEEEAQTTVAEETETEAEEESKSNSKDYHLENADATMEDGILVVYQDNHWRALILYGGLYDTLYADTLNYIRQVLDDDVNMYFMPVPLSAQFYLPANYADYSVDQQEVYEDVSSRLAEGITSINIIDTLNDHNQEAIYLRTDHHWAQLGAYYAAQEFAAAANVPFADLSTYTQYINEGYVGTMYAYTSSSNLLNDPEDFVYYVPTNSYTVDYYDSYFDYNFTFGLFYDTAVENSYSMYMGGDTQIVKVTTDVENGRRLLVVKDSYGNAEIPYYTNSFQEIYVIDQRYFDVNLISFIQYNAITDVLFTHNYMSLTGAEAELLEYITYNNYDYPVYDDAPEAVLPER